jgi:organic radical activating enzyme
MIPIKIEKAVPANIKFVEWMLHNVCNNDCSFCGSHIKDGSKRWLTIEKYKAYADKIIAACDGYPFWIQFTGGEPTLFPELSELMEYVKQQGAYVSLISNGSRTLRWWEELKQKKLIDHLFITYHSEQTTDYKHATDVLNLFHDENVETVCMITHTIESINRAIEARNFINDETGTLVLFKAMMISEYDIYSLYTHNQSDEVKKTRTHGKKSSSKKHSIVPKEHRFGGVLKVTYDTGISVNVDSQYLFKTKQNNFFNWTCSVGIDTMRIEVDTVFRGVCHVNEKQFSLDESNISFSDAPTICDKQSCFCSIDIETTKIK